MKKRFSLGSYFRRIYLLLVAFILVPLFLVGGISFKLMSDRTYESFRTRQELLADDLCASAEELIRYVEDEIVYIALTSSDRSLFDTSPDLILNSISDSLAGIVRRNPIVKNACYIQRSTGNLLNTAGGIYNINYYYDTEWLSQIDYRPLMRRYPVRIPADASYCKDLYFLGYHDVKPVISISYGSIYSDIYLVNISVDALKNELISAYSLADSSTVLRIYGIDEPVEKSFLRDGNKVIFTDCMYYGLLGYTLEYDYNLYSTGESYYITALLIIAAILAVCAIILAGYAADIIYAPVSKLWNEVAASNSHKRFLTSPGADEIELLKEAFREINLDRQNAQKSAALYKDAASSSALSMFLETGMPTGTFLDYATDFSDGDRFRITIVSSKAPLPDSTVSLLNLYLKGHVRSLATPLSKGRIGVLTVSDSTFDAAGRIRSVMTDAAGLDCSIVASDYDTELTVVQDVYKLLLEGIERAEFYGVTDRILYSGDFPGKPTEPVWSREVNIEAGIIKSVINGDTDSFDAIIGELFSHLELMPVDYFRSVLQAVLLTVDGELNWARKLGHDIIEDVTGLRSSEEFNIYFAGMFKEASALYRPNESTEQKHCIMAKEILEREYVRDIDVLSVADMLGLSYPYLSKIFKNCYGTTLSEYLNTYRIEKSCELLIKGNATLETIAQAVGYNNTQSFQRFFKKNKGMTPTEYRRSVSSAGTVD